MKNGVKMLDIAEKLGVSVVTVSNALAGRDGVSDSMRRKICEVAEKMGYKPSNTRYPDFGTLCWAERYFLLGIDR